MNINSKLIIILFLCWVSCNQPPTVTTGQINICDCDTSESFDTINGGNGALLGSRFSSLEELKSVIQIQYFNNNTSTDSSVHLGSKVCITDCNNGKKIISVLETGISQGDFKKAKEGSIWDQLSLLVHSPFAVINRKELEKVFLLSRRLTDVFGEGDQAFYYLAEAAFKNINTPDLAFKTPRDSSEKGYINTFNHITAQAFITACFSEELADFVGDSHERFYHPRLIIGKFSVKELNDLDEGPVDNYVDLVNNEWGQELGKELKAKFKINSETNWTPMLVTNILNDLQSYFSWAFQIGFNPFSPEDEVVIRFSDKINSVESGKVKIEKTHPVV